MVTYSYQIIFLLLKENCHSHMLRLKVRNFTYASISILRGQV